MYELPKQDTGGFSKTGPMPKHVQFFDKRLPPLTIKLCGGIPTKRVDIWFNRIKQSFVTTKVAQQRDKQCLPRRGH